MGGVAAAVVVASLFVMPAGAQATCTAVGSERWTVKTMAPIDSGQPRAFTAAEFAALPAPPHILERGEKLRDTRYPDPVSSGVREGALVSVIGWVQLIKTSPDDCDYHIQITPTMDGATGTVIVEVPDGDAEHVADPALRRELAAERTLIRQQLNLKSEPSKRGNVIAGRAYMAFTGALFFDGPHYPHCDARGEKAKAVTCWEVHPVVGSRFVPRPQR